MFTLPTLRDVVSPRRLPGRVKETPVESSPELSAQEGAELVLKWENQQLTGSCKVCGALNTVNAVHP